jgi:NCS2 family nucleobase:cation symporter-2
MIVAYVIAIFMGDVNFSGVSKAAWFALPEPFKYGFDINLTVIIAMCLMSIVSAIETVGDISGIAKGGANREATDKELQGGTYADGIGTAVAGIFGGLPNTSFSQNVGLISMTGVMSRSVVTIAAIFLILCGLVPKIGALVSSMPIAVLGGGVIVMFGMVASAGINMLSSVNWNRRNMMIFAISLSIGFGLQKVPASVQGLGGDLQMLMTSGLLPAAFLAVLLNIILPEEDK